MTVALGRHSLAAPARNGVLRRRPRLPRRRRGRAIARRLGPHDLSREPRSERRECEQCEPDNEDAPAPEEIRDTPAQQEEAGERDQVRVDDPLQIRGRERQAVLDAQCDRDNDPTTRRPRVGTSCRDRGST